MASVAAVTASMLSTSPDYNNGTEVKLEPKMDKGSKDPSPTPNKQHVHYELWGDSQGDIKVSHTTSVKPDQRYLKNNQKVQNDGSQVPGSNAVWLSSSGPHIANATSVAVAPVARSLSNRSQGHFGVNSIKFSTMHSAGQTSEYGTQTTNKKKKLGHRRVKVDGEVTFKKIETTQLIGSIQLGIQHAVGSLANVPHRDLLMQDFMTVDTVYFSKSGSQQTPAHNYSDFRFRTYASFAFRTFRKLFSIETDLFLASLCSEPMIELSNPGASGSIFYVTSDDNFVCKTVDHKEGEFLKILLAGYYLNLQQNQRTLLPKFFGLYCYSCNTKNVRIVVMNNLLPSDLKMHHKFDLKGSTYKRKASRREKNKASPTYKDLDFLEMYPDGISLTSEIYVNLMNSIQRDCRVLESFKIMDYSLLVGIHNIDQAAKEREQILETVLSSGDSGVGDTTTGGQSASGASDCESGSTEKCAERSHHFPMFERQSSFIHRERMIAHSTALESITINVDSASSHPGGDDQVLNESNSGVTNTDGIKYSSQFTEEDCPQHLLPSGAEAKSSKVGGKSKDEVYGMGVDNVWGGIPAKNHRGENLLLFIGIIDILQSYGMLKKMEHYWKSLVHDGDTVSVHRPGFFARRFQNFMKDKVFKKQEIVRPKPSSGIENVPGVTFGAGPGPSSHRKSHYRRALSTVSGANTSVNGANYEQINPAERTDNEVLSPPVRGGTSKEKGVTVITINSNPSDNVFLPPVLQDKKPRMHSGSQASDFNEPEISFNTLNQSRNIKLSTSSNASEGSNERKNETHAQKMSTDKNVVSYNRDRSNSGSETHAEIVTLKVPSKSQTSSGGNQNIDTGRVNLSSGVDESSSIGLGPVGVGPNNPETGSIITMTSDERVQIFVPSPSGGGTPYSTITKASGGVANLSSQGGSVLLGTEFRGLSPRPPSTSRSWEPSNIGLGNHMKNNTLGVNATMENSASSSGILRPPSSDGMSDESNHVALSSSMERSPPPFAKRVFAGSDVYRSLTPLNMDCPSSDEGAFNTRFTNGKYGPDQTSLSANEMSQRYESGEMVFSSSPPRGPLATLAKGPSEASSSIETSLDMIKISLRDSNEECTNGSSQDNMNMNIDKSDNKTTLTVISSVNSHEKAGKNEAQHIVEQIEQNTKIDCTVPSDDEYSSLDRTIVDSELPSLPTDNAISSGRTPENKCEESILINTKFVQTAEQSETDTEPISLSDIKLIENSQ